MLIQHDGVMGIFANTETGKLCVVIVDPFEVARAESVAAEKTVVYLHCSMEATIAFSAACVSTSAFSSAEK